MSVQTPVQILPEATDPVVGTDTPLGLSAAYTGTPYFRRIVSRQKSRTVKSKFVYDWDSIRDLLDYFACWPRCGQIDEDSGDEEGDDGDPRDLAIEVRVSSSQPVKTEAEWSDSFSPEFGVFSRGPGSRDEAPWAFYQDGAVTGGAGNLSAGVAIRKSVSAGDKMSCDPADLNILVSNAYDVLYEVRNPLDIPLRLSLQVNAVPFVSTEFSNTVATNIDPGEYVRILTQLRCGPNQIDWRLVDYGVDGGGVNHVTISGEPDQFNTLEMSPSPHIGVWGPQLVCGSGHGVTHINGASQTTPPYETVLTPGASFEMGARGEIYCPALRGVYFDTPGGPYPVTGKAEWQSGIVVKFCDARVPTPVGW